MTLLNISKFVEDKKIWRNAYYVLLMVTVVTTRLLKLYTNTLLFALFSTVFIAGIVFDFFLVDRINCKYDVSIIVRYIEFIVLLVFEGTIASNVAVAAMIASLTFANVVEFIIQNADYDGYTITIRKIFAFIPTILLCVYLYFFAKNVNYCYYIFRVTILAACYISVDLYVSEFKAFSVKKNEMLVRISQAEDKNNALQDYRDKVQLVNEQINFQRLELSTAYSNLEAVNIETNALTEIMKFLTSSFDVAKCLNVIVDTIMSVKKPKICAIYVDKDVYMNRESTYIVKSDYTSMQRRLKKDIAGIYQDVCDNKYANKIIVGEAVSAFKFVGDTTINQIAILPLADKNKKYGVMIVAASGDDFFDNGLSFYENCIIQFNLSIKSTLLYLKTVDMARKDGLTGIYNRVYFKELFEKAVASIKRKELPLSVALYDIDKFKLVNDTYGHLAGDTVIKMVASAGQKYASKYDGFVCRYGGEEFLLVFPGKDKDEVVSIIEQMHEEIRNTVVKHNDLQINVNVCIGLSIYPTICKDTNLLISRADKAMYYGKKHGRGRFVIDNPDIDNVLSE